MKFPIEWHEERLENRRTHLESQITARDRLSDLISDMRIENYRYRYQIDLAKQRGLKEFDRDRLGVPRKKKE
jgi:hypothetical protein